MKIAILTTDTTHHKYFVSQICNYSNEVICVFESNILKPQFATKVNFEKQREKFEKKKWFNNKPINLAEVKNLKILNVSKGDNKKSINFLKKNNVDLIILFGVKKISKLFLEKFKKKIFNLHGGDLKEYRGLDSHYWAIYHNDFKSLIVTLHTVELKLDTGKIVYEKKIKFNKTDRIHQIRYKNTNICVSLVNSLIKKLRLKKKYTLNKPIFYGRYYSFMPKQLKTIVEKKFNSYCKKI
jgi:methionyl-tRNA formyltransferase